MKNTTEKIMQWWAKIGSFGFLAVVLYVLNITVQIVQGYQEIQETRLKLAALGQYIPNLYSFGDLLQMFFGMGLYTLSAFFLFLPFFLYGWDKDPEPGHPLAKGVSILWSGALVLMLYNLMDKGFTNKVDHMLIFLFLLIFAAPLYYFAWRK